MFTIEFYGLCNISEPRVENITNREFNHGAISSHRDKKIIHPFSADSAADPRKNFSGGGGAVKCSPRSPPPRERRESYSFLS